MSSEEIILDQNLDGKPFTPHSMNLASTGLRFANRVVDMIVVYVFIFVIIGLEAVIDGGGFASETGELASGASTMLRLVGIFALLLYYLIMEATTGRTIGKYVTGTMVVNESGERPDFVKVLLRTLSRIVPLEALSAFSSSKRMWHDRWTDTYVVRVR